MALAAPGVQAVRVVDCAVPDVEAAMAPGYYFHPESMSAEQYNRVILRLEEAGAGSPPGLHTNARSRSET